MVIGVISPNGHNNGVTTIATMLAYEYGTNEQICLANIDAKKHDLAEYTGVYTAIKESSGNEIDRLARMVQSGGVKTSEIVNYLQRVPSYDIKKESNKVYVCTSCGNTEETNMADIIKYICNSGVFEHVIIDIDVRELANDNVEDVINETDLLVVVLNQSRVYLEKFYNNRKGIMRKIGKKPMIVVLNKFNSAAGSIKDAGNMLNMKAINNWSSIRYNPYIIWATNKEKMLLTQHSAMSGDPDVQGVFNDIKKLANSITKVKVAIRDKKIEEMVIKNTENKEAATQTETNSEE